MKQTKIQLLLTGNELMTGDIVDSNSAMIAQKLKDLGLGICRKVTVADELTMLIDEICHISEKSDVLIINGGLGPTIDDMTAQALAGAAELPLKQHPQALEHLKSWCKKRQTELNGPNLKQAMLPQGCRIIANRSGSAVGFYLRFNDCDIYCTPGVPHELKTMFNEEIIPQLTQHSDKTLKLDVTRLQIFGYGESSIQKLINDNVANWPAEVELGFRAGMPLLELKLTTTSAQSYQVKQALLIELKQLLGDHIIAKIDNQAKGLAEHVFDLLLSSNKKITFAESCTGGLIASQLTQISGSSAVFEAGFVTYSNSIKNKLLAVNNDTLSKYGAVSQKTVIEMALGALKTSAADFTIAVSGIAGPTGGTIDKPVGTVWIAWGNKETLHSQCFLLPITRHYFQKYVAAIAFDLIRRLLLESKEVPNYIIERGVK
jgi:nicotinamide-nucleotide amidase